MVRAVYLLCEAVTLYVICALVMIVFLYFAGFHFNGGTLSPIHFIVIGILIALAPMSLTAVTIGPWVGAGTTVRGQPVRPLAMILPAAITLVGSSEMPLVGGRQPIRIVFEGDIDSIDVVARLAGHLTALGIPHSHVGGIHAQDRDVRWQLAPVIGEPCLEGWVEAPGQADRTSVIAAITGFLKQQLKLDVEVTR
jgi:hypothetical protein